MKTLILAGAAMVTSLLLSALGVDHIAWHLLAGVTWGFLCSMTD